MRENLYPRGVDSARVIQVIETKSARGSGSTEQPARIVTEYWSLDGKKLAERDSGCFVPEEATGYDSASLQDSSKWFMKLDKSRMVDVGADDLFEGK